MSILIVALTISLCLPAFLAGVQSDMGVQASGYEPAFTGSAITMSDIQIYAQWVLSSSEPAAVEATPRPITGSMLAAGAWDAAS